MVTRPQRKECQNADAAPRAAVPEPRIEIADFIEFMNSLPKNSVDLILTDPPYTISKETGFQSVVNGVQRFAVSMDFGEWDHCQIDLAEMARVFYRALRRGGTAIVWYDLWKIGEVKDAMEQAGFKMIRQIIWEKTNPVPLNMKATYLSNCREMAVAGVKVGKPTFHSEYDSGIYRYPIPRHNGNRQHPTQKEEELFAELVLKHSNPGDLVVDPFLGAGTTAMAALRNGRSFTGCDIDERYVQISRERVMREVNRAEPT
jgi:DNA modification methylase